MIDKVKKLALRKIYMFFFYSVYFFISFKGFWKIRGVILDLTFLNLITIISGTALFLVPILCVYIIITSRFSLKNILITWLKTLIFMDFLFGYVAFFYPSCYSGRDITNSQFFKILIPIIIGSALPLLKSLTILLKEIYNLIKEI